MTRLSDSLHVLAITFIASACSPIDRADRTSHDSPLQPSTEAFAYPAYARITTVTLPTEATPESPGRLTVPARPKGALTGSAFLKATDRLSLVAREQRVLQELLRGNVPSFARQLVPVRVSARTENGFIHRGWVFVTPDYLAIGSDEDFVRMPMDPLTAQKVADAYGGMLPTSAMVSAIYDAAPVKLMPFTMRPGKPMRFNGYIRKHEAHIADELRGKRPGVLIAGHKKDIVLSNRLLTRPKRVAIYGWHTEPGLPIQPLSTWHKKSYSDYSHALRLVWPVIVIDGESWEIADVLRHPTLSLMLSEEGPVQLLRIDSAAVEWNADEKTPAPRF